MIEEEDFGGLVCNQLIAVSAVCNAIFNNGPTDECAECSEMCIETVGFFVDENFPDSSALDLLNHPLIMAEGESLLALYHAIAADDHAGTADLQHRFGDLQMGDLSLEM